MEEVSLVGKVSGLGHFGVFVKDMPKMIDFYTNTLGMTLTDRGPDDRIVFLSAQPEKEHHELALAKMPPDGQRTDAGQISFHVETLQDLKALHRKIRDYGCQSLRVTNHGIAFGYYFKDPEDNTVEVYWSTGMDYPQPHGSPIDLETTSDEDLLRMLEEMEPKEGTGQHYYGKDVGKRLPVAQKA
jgi:catechol 2,3-dioxygenase-like lactoylglutathione lyase family enzyme